MKRLLALAILGLACCVVTSAHASIVLDQIYAPSTYPRANGDPTLAGKSGHFTEPEYQSFSTSVVDDFTVSATTLDLTSVSAVILAQGGTFTTFGAIPGWEVAVYSSLGAAKTSLTGDVADVFVPASSATLSTGFNNNGDNNALLTLPINIVLPAAGTYYLGILSRNPLNTTGWVDVYTFGTNGGGNAYLEAPYANGGATSSAFAGDAAYRIIGQAAVPEPSTWALLGLGVTGLLGSAVRRRMVV